MISADHATGEDDLQEAKYEMEGKKICIDQSAASETGQFAVFDNPSY